MQYASIPEEKDIFAVEKLAEVMLLAKQAIGRRPHRLCSFQNSGS